MEIKQRYQTVTEVMKSKFIAILFPKKSIPKRDMLFMPIASVKKPKVVMTVNRKEQQVDLFWNS